MEKDYLIFIGKILVLLVICSFFRPLEASHIIGSIREPDIYLTTTVNQERVIVLGSGHNYGVLYPKNYYLVDRDQRYKPDLNIDISEKGSIPNQFTDKFDVVIWERVDTPYFVKEETLNNIKKLLKPGGKLITHFMVQTRNLNILNSSLHRELLDISVGIKAFEPTRAPIPFICFVDDAFKNKLPPKLRGKDLKILESVIAPMAESDCFSNLFKPWLKSKGFKNVKWEKKSSYWKTDPDPDGYIQATYLQ